jgi:hydrogenase maturation protease
MKNIKTDPAKILLISIGNCGRGDDGLGWQFAEWVQQAGNDQFDFEYRYQLQIEDSIIISEYEMVIFVDASHEILEKGFEIKPCVAAGHYFYSSHMQSPETILYLAGDLYNKYPEAYTIAIAGHYWELKTSLSKEAKRNLRSAFTFFENDFLPHIQSRAQLHKNKLLA